MEWFIEDIGYDQERLEEIMKRSFSEQDLPTPEGSIKIEQSHHVGSIECTYSVERPELYYSFKIDFDAHIFQFGKYLLGAHKSAVLNGIQ